MEKNIIPIEDKRDELRLQGRLIIDDVTARLVFHARMIAEEKSLRVMINEGKPVWVMTLRNGEKWYYEPFTHEVRKAENIRFGRIYFNRVARYLRDEYTHKGCIKKVYSVYLCTRKTMFLIKEVKEYWPQGLQDDPDPKIRELAGGYYPKTSWFKPFPSSAEAEEFNKDFY